LGTGPLRCVERAAGQVSPLPAAPPLSLTADSGQLPGGKHYESWGFPAVAAWEQHSAYDSARACETDRKALLRQRSDGSLGLEQRSELGGEGEHPAFPKPRRTHCNGRPGA
jgi:hypothetical protein